MVDFGETGYSHLFDNWLCLMSIKTTLKLKFSKIFTSSSACFHLFHLMLKAQHINWAWLASLFMQMPYITINKIIYFKIEWQTCPTKNTNQIVAIKHFRCCKSWSKHIDVDTFLRTGNNTLAIRKRDLVIHLLFRCAFSSPMQVSFSMTTCLFDIIKPLPCCYMRCR